MTATRDLLLQAGPAASFEVFPRRRGSGEHHLYVRGLAVSEWASLFRRELAGRTVYVFEMCASALNPAYWDEYSESAEREMRERIGGTTEKRERGVRYLWRADRVPAGRALRDGIGVSPTILAGPVFKFEGGVFLQAAPALADPGERVRLAVASPPRNGQSREAELLPLMAEDLGASRMSLAEEEMLFANEGVEGRVRMVFARSELAQKALEGAIRGVFHRISGEHVANIRKAVVQDLLHLADGVGAFADPSVDFADKDRSLELTLHLGATGWGPGRELPGEDPRLLVYYDRTSGIWDAVAL